MDPLPRPLVFLLLLFSGWGRPAPDGTSPRGIYIFVIILSRQTQNSLTPAAYRGRGDPHVDEGCSAASLLLRLAHRRTPTVLFVTVHSALWIFLWYAFTLHIMIHPLTGTMMVLLSFC
jgi:hypothetical protein